MNNTTYPDSGIHSDLLDNSTMTEAPTDEGDIVKMMSGSHNIWTPLCVINYIVSAILVLFGVGNMLVLSYICYNKATKSVYNYLVATMACVNMLRCEFTVWMLLAEMITMFQTHSAVWCHVRSVVTAFSFFYGPVLMTVIAIWRFLSADMCSYKRKYCMLTVGAVVLFSVGITLPLNTNMLNDDSSDLLLSCIKQKPILANGHVIHTFLYIQVGIVLAFSSLALLVVGVTWAIYKYKGVDIPKGPHELLTIRNMSIILLGTMLLSSVPNFLIFPFIMRHLEESHLQDKAMQFNIMILYNWIMFLDCGIIPIIYIKQEPVLRFCAKHVKELCMKKLYCDCKKIAQLDQEKAEQHHINSIADLEMLNTVGVPSEYRRTLSTLPLFEHFF